MEGEEKIERERQEIYLHREIEREGALETYRER